MSRSRSNVRLGALVLATMAVAALGCGGSSDAAAQFTGTWHYDMATGPLDCGGDIIPQAPLGNKTFAPGVSSALVDVSASPLDDLVYCDFEFDVAGPIATAQPQQSCALTGGNAVVTIASWTFTLTSATTADEVANTNVVVAGQPTSTDPTPAPSSCTFVLMAKLTKVAKD
jgi:hypothetical protein